MTDILEIIRPHVHLERQEKNYVGLCPFHQEKTPSFTVDPSEQTFCCLGCGAHGDAGEFAKTDADERSRCGSECKPSCRPEFHWSRCRSA